MLEGGTGIIGVFVEFEGAGFSAIGLNDVGDGRREIGEPETGVLFVFGDTGALECLALGFEVNLLDKDFEKLNVGL